MLAARIAGPAARTAALEFQPGQLAPSARRCSESQAAPRSQTRVSENRFRPLGIMHTVHHRFGRIGHRRIDESPGHIQERNRPTPTLLADQQLMGGRRQISPRLAVVLYRVDKRPTDVRSARPSQKGLASRRTPAGAATRKYPGRCPVARTNRSFIKGISDPTLLRDRRAIRHR